MSNMSGLNAYYMVSSMANAARANREARRADAAEDALQKIRLTELLSIGNVVSARAAFAQAAGDMGTELKQKTGADMTKDLSAIKVRKGLFSIFRTTVPQDVLVWAKAEAQKVVNKIVSKHLSKTGKDLPDVAAEGLNGPEGENYFEPGRGTEFVEDLDQTEIRAIARTGVANALQGKLMDLLEEAGPSDILGERPDSMTRQQYRALYQAFLHAAENTLTACQTLKEPYEKIVKANLPAPQNA